MLTRRTALKGTVAAICVAATPALAASGYVVENLTPEERELLEAFRRLAPDCRPLVVNLLRVIPQEDGS